MTGLTPSEWERISTLRWHGLRSLAVQEGGDRSARPRNSGIEFIEHRPYEPGDEVRAVDPHAWARLGRLHVRQFRSEVGMPVTLVLDATASMGESAVPGSDRRFPVARDVLTALAVVTLFGGDTLRVAVCDGAGVHWLYGVTHRGRIPELQRWLERYRPAGQRPSDRLARDVAANLPERGLCIWIGDFFDESAPAAVETLAATGAEVLGLQVLVPGDRDPGWIGAGAFELDDVEGGSVEPLYVDESVHGRYREELEAWQSELTRRFRRLGGRFLALDAERGAAELVGGVLRRAGWLR